MDGDFVLDDSVLFVKEGVMNGLSWEGIAVGQDHICCDGKGLPAALKLPWGGVETAPDVDWVGVCSDHHSTSTSAFSGSVFSSSSSSLSQFCSHSAFTLSASFLEEGFSLSDSMHGSRHVSSSKENIVMIVLGKHKDIC